MHHVKMPRIFNLKGIHTQYFKKIKKEFYGVICFMSSPFLLVYAYVLECIIIIIQALAKEDVLFIYIGNTHSMLETG